MDRVREGVGISPPPAVGAGRYVGVRVRVQESVGCGRPVGKGRLTGKFEDCSSSHMLDVVVGVVLADTASAVDEPNGGVAVSVVNVVLVVIVGEPVLVSSSVHVLVNVMVAELVVNPAASTVEDAIIVEIVEDSLHVLVGTMELVVKPAASAVEDIITVEVVEVSLHVLVVVDVAELVEMREVVVKPTASAVEDATIVNVLEVSLHVLVVDNTVEPVVIMELVVKPTASAVEDATSDVKVPEVSSHDDIVDDASTEAVLCVDVAGGVLTVIELTV
jgi:hypothetical protein